MTESHEPSSRPTFLVVDDDALVRKLVSRGLAELDPGAVIEVEDGLAAQEVLRTRTVDVVVTDVLMPKLGGLDLMKWAQTHAPGPLWIVLSGLDTFDAAVEALHLGAFDYLAKPPEVQRVRVAVRNALDQIELVREGERLNRELAQSNDRLAEKVVQLEKVCRMLEDQAEVIQADLVRAEVIQRALLPQVPPRIDGWCVETLYRPGNNVGGDIYDVVMLDDRHVGLVIADAAGHGVAAAMLSVLFKHRLKLKGEDGNPLMPNRVLRALNRSLHQTMSAPGAFITAAYVLLNPRTGRARVASAGHPPCILHSPGGESRLLERTGPALGLEADASYEETSIELGVGDRLLLYTDGVLEGGPASPTQDDLSRAMLSEPDRSELLGALFAAAVKEIEGERDDITMILLERGQGVSRFDDLPKAAPKQKISAPPQAQLLQSRAGKDAFMSIAGTATWMRSQMFFDAANRLLERARTLTIDLGACEYLDSTFLGTLHEIVMSRPDAVRLQRVPVKIRALFEELSMSGVLQHTSLVNEPLPADMEPLRRDEPDAVTQGERMLKAHEVLVSLSEENSAQFRDVVASLRADLETPSS
ncbi:MAG: SpoIIE family protein phosphatase [Pseudomonadales bacterium]